MTLRDTIGGVGSFLHEINNFLFIKNKKITGTVGFVIIVILTILVFKAEADAESDILTKTDILNRILGGGRDDLDDIKEIEGYEHYIETNRIAGELQEGQNREIPIMADESRVIEHINVSLTWSDEQDIRRIRLFENTPDTFSVEIIGPEGNISLRSSASNDGGSDGEIVLSKVLTPEEIRNTMGRGGFKVIITLEEVGDYEARLGAGIIGPSDTGNDFSISIEIGYFSPPEKT